MWSLQLTFGYLFQFNLTGLVNSTQLCSEVDPHCRESWVPSILCLNLRCFYKNKNPLSHRQKRWRVAPEGSLEREPIRFLPKPLSPSAWRPSQAGGPDIKPPEGFRSGPLTDCHRETPSLRSVPTERRRQPGEREGGREEGGRGGGEMEREARHGTFPFVTLEKRQVELQTASWPGQLTLRLACVRARRLTHGTAD